ncbi:MAG TPA: DPP IV N-terminal domain-containing protein [Bryobacteraceae bacterium]|nr:DPP IV N-terminal domain-containing protein [Bryobacteraceae bacterium]
MSIRSIVWFPALALCTALIFDLRALHSQTRGKKPVTLGDAAAAVASGSVTPIWTPDGSAFAYEEKDSLYLYRVNERKATEWFQPAELKKAAKKPEEPADSSWQNRRVDSESFQWFPNGKDMLAAAGGDLFVVHGNGRYKQITKTGLDEEDPKLSPDGKRVLYRWKSNLYVLDLASKQTRQLTTDGTPTLLNGQLDWVYPEELDLHTATWWSPDSKQIAYLQFDVGREFLYPHADLLGERAVAEPQRYPQAGTSNPQVKLGVIAADGGATKWMELGENANSLLARVAWLPDSSQLSVERLNRVQDRLDLLFCNPVSGEARTVIHEESKTWINMVDNLTLLKTRPEFLWTSERGNGFRHIYRYSNKGEMLGQLTSGDWEVKTIEAVDEERQKVYFTSAEASPLESQLYSVGFGGGERTRVTQEAGVHRIQANQDGSAYVDSFSSSKRPPEVQLRTASGESAVLRPADLKPLEEFDLLPSEIVEVKAEDGATMYGRLTKPASFQAGTKYPLIVDVYGGPGIQVVLNEWQGVDRAQAFAHKGYVVWQMDNRGSSGRGHAFETPIYRELGKHEVADQRRGVERLIAMGLVDPKRVGITGWSYGGFMTLRSMLLAPDVFKVGVAGAPVTDWRNYDTIYTERYMGMPEQNRKAYEETSNVRNAGKLEGRLLLLHNIEDDNVLFQNTMQMANALEKAGKQFFMQIYPQKTHGVSGSLRKPLLEAMAAFFDSNLKNTN